MRVAVLGAGVAGLTAAHRLTKVGHEVDVYERWPGLGGQAATIDTGDGVLVERYYHHLFTSDRDMADLCSEIGLRARDVAVERRHVRRRGAASVHDAARPSPLQADGAVEPSSDGPGGAVAPAAGSLGGAIRVDHASNGSRRRWVGRPGRRSGAHSSTGSFAIRRATSRCRGCGRSSKPPPGLGRGGQAGAPGLPEGELRVDLRTLRDLIEERGGRVLIDRPAARVGRSEGFWVWPAQARSFRRGHDPQEWEWMGSRSATTR